MIVDSCYRPGTGIDLWYRDKGIRREQIPVQPQFCLHLPDNPASRDLIEGLEAVYPVEKCRFRTLFGDLFGFSVAAGRDVAEAIETQSRYTARIYNADIRQDQKYLAEHNLVCCKKTGESRFDPECTCDLKTIEIRLPGQPAITSTISSADIISDATEHIAGSERECLDDLFRQVEQIDPDVILIPHADAWMQQLVRKARDYGLSPPFSRTGRFRLLNSRSYWTYGRVEHREGALMPDGRILIDTEQSFVYREGGLAGVVIVSGLTGLSPNLASRFTPGTLISGYEIYEAFRQGIVVPFRKGDAEQSRNAACLKTADRGGMMFQPVAGCCEQVSQIDFTSMYPSIIVKENLSPETIGCTGRKGFLAGVLEPLLDLRIRTKQLKKTDARYEGVDAVLKWMLVTCFGYTGYKNAKFGRIEVHEAITARSREILLGTKAIAEEMGLEVIHGIVDCLWVRGGDTGAFQTRVEQSTGIHTEMDHYDWIVFLPLADGFGAYNRYYGRLADGSIKVRGIAARRHDTPGYVRRMQQEMLTSMAEARTRHELARKEQDLQRIYRTYCNGLASAPLQDMLIHRRISRLTYARRCIEGAAVQAYRQAGISVSPGMKIGYVVRDARAYLVDTEWNATDIDRAYYRKLLDNAWEDCAFAVRQCQKKEET